MTATVTAWRIVKTDWASRAFDGEGARLYGGRWNNIGQPVVYTAATLSLAALEMLVHLEAADLERAYSFIPVLFDASLVRELPDLPANWRDNPAPVSARETGDRWLKAMSSAVLRVPSALIPQEFNYLLNPRHPDFSQLRIGEPLTFDFDKRLKQ